MATRKGGRPREWHREFFEDHPGLSANELSSKSLDGKPIVYCKECLARNLVQERESNELEVQRGQRVTVRDDQSIKAELFTRDMQREGYRYRTPETKSRLRRHFGQPAEASGAQERVASEESASEDDMETETPSSEVPTVLSGEFRDAFRHLPDDEDTDLQPAEIYAGAMPSSRISYHVPIRDLFDFNSTSWIRRISKYASQGLDRELELYELLDFDAEGDDDMDMQDVAEDILYN
ncbi:hypothetical protein OH76DRAFT_1408475 [Lentinus brumalis]|uniref:Uncharacterized protein n=1 Tax=Lentinus brumalis TaxID=2498619 RepID=A0A371CXN8_9APHY|nr:hypothetical protein OH76DRAFT_1408475 [Polyporus brumalis]